MQNSKVKKLILKYEEFLIVDQGLHQSTAIGYAKCMSIALRRMRNAKHSRTPKNKTH